MEDTKNEDLQNTLSNFDVYQRFDANDGKKHMGLLMLSPKCSKFKNFDPDLLRGFKDNTMDSQGFILRIKNTSLKIAFLYIRPGKATKALIRDLLNKFDCHDCDIVMGDLNLNPKIPIDKKRLDQLCQEGKLEPFLNEPTTKSFTQIDYILGSSDLRGKVYVTTFFNFISDHKTPVVRIGLGNNSLLKEVMVNSSKTSHLKVLLDDNVSPPNSEFHRTGDEIIDSHVNSVGSSKGDIDVSCFTDREWLTSDVINAYGSILKSQFNEDVFVFSTFFYISLLNRGIDGMKGWTKNINIFCKEFVFFPIHEHDHWYLIYLNNKEKTLNLLDPYEPLSGLKLPKSLSKDISTAKKMEEDMVELEHKK